MKERTYKKHLTRLKTAYRASFQVWALMVRRLTDTRRSPANDASMAAATTRVATAEAEYRDSRDRLVEFMRSEPAQTVVEPVNDQARERAASLPAAR
jgi:hypothetical protein